MINRNLFTILFILFIALSYNIQPLFAQSSSSIQTIHLDSFLQETKGKDDNKKNKNNLVQPALIVGTAFGLYHYDQNIQRWSQNHRNDNSNQVANFSKNFGEVKYVIPALGIAHLYGKSHDDNKLARTGLLGMESVIAANIITGGLKMATHRHRPNNDDSSSNWDGFKFSKDNVSFPSGHAATAFACATVIANEYKENRTIVNVAYGLATLSGLSRINDNEHWTSDVFIGSAIGYYTAKAIIRSRDKKSSIHISPTVGAKGAMLIYNSKF